MNSSDYDAKYVKVLDGIRALAILIIVWYHIWQQSWLGLKIGSFNLDFIPRYGFLFVDLMILLSGFCLFIPYAKSVIYKEELPDTKKFYIKRIARIFPSYFISMIISVIFLIIFKDNWFNLSFIKDTLMHIFFAHNWSIETIIATNYIGVLWTIAIEVQFYLLFPFIAKRFIKKPFLIYAIMMIIGIISTIIIKNNLNSSNTSYYVNHFLTFIPVFANGMLGAWIYISYTKNVKRTKVSDLFFTIVSLLLIVSYYFICKSIGYDKIMEWQINNRILLSFYFLAFTISTCLSSKIYSWLFSNKLMKFMALISFNLYIYHQFIAVKLKEFRIPFYSGDVSIYMNGDKAWQWTYSILCLIVAIIVAIIMTYLIEKPIAKYIRNKYYCDEKKQV